MVGNTTPPAKQLFSQSIGYGTANNVEYQSCNQRRLNLAKIKLHLISVPKKSAVFAG